MSDVVIRARDLCKVYRLYAKPHYRFLDMFGLLRGRAGAYTEHAALDGVTLDIRRGEKVAIIGRNGAGKSTLLKLVTGVIEPSAGTIEVAGRVHALLQLGTGFHPDFTGRENVYAYLAQLGVTGAEADRRCAEIVEFAEIEEYIDQPVKTYSTGMGVRLMFSTSTAIAPDLLVLDEVLGVGDAYFARKSYERISELCESDGTTLLLVSHDVYSAAKICARMIWIDSGRTIVDGDAGTVVKLYDDSIRAQEEQRLRKKHAGPSTTVVVGQAPSAQMLIEFKSMGNRPAPGSIYFSRISAMAEGHPPVHVPLIETAAASGQRGRILRDGGRWGDLVAWQGQEAREMLPYGGPFHKVAVEMQVPWSLLTDESQLVIAVEYGSDHEHNLKAVAYLGEEVRELGTLPMRPGEWMRQELVWQKAPSVAPLDVHASGNHGAGDVLITSVRLLDAEGRDVRAIAHGAPVVFEIGYRVMRSGLRECAEVFLVISRNTSERICKFMTADLMFDSASPAGVIRMSIPKMMLSAGTYEVAVEVAAAGYIERGTGMFYSIDPDVYHCLTHALEFSVLDSGWMGDYTIFEGSGEWEIRPHSTDSQTS